MSKINNNMNKNEVKKSDKKEKKVEKKINLKVLLKSFNKEEKSDDKIAQMSELLVQEAEKKLLSMIQTRAALALFAAGVIDENGEEVPETPRRNVGRPKGSFKKDKAPAGRKYGKRGRPTKEEVAQKDNEEAAEMKRIAAEKGEKFDEAELPAMKRAKVAADFETMKEFKAETKKAEEEKAVMVKKNQKYLTRKRLASN